MTKDKDYKLCKKNAPIRNEFRHPNVEKNRELRDYYEKTRQIFITSDCENDCFHDFYVKSNEPGNSTVIYYQKL